ncbi:MAG: asparagine--tRNA ligase [Chloroflexota bacterium]
MTRIDIAAAGQHVGESVEIRGWLYNRRSSGKIQFLEVRDGTGFIQGVLVKSEVGDATFTTADHLTQESSIIVRGQLREDKRSKWGFEIGISDLEIVQAAAEDYPVTHKEHGVDFLLDNRHLWLRTPRQVAIMRIRNEVILGLQEFFNERGFLRIDSPILTPVSCEGTTTLFGTDYFDTKAYLSQTGQLYAEAAALAFGKVYNFGPTFRAEKSKTRRHLTEFWMLEPEMAYCDQAENMRVQEEMIEYVVQRVLHRRAAELKMLERDITKLENIRAPFPRISYDDAIKFLQGKGHQIEWGDDLGSPDETAIAEAYDRPVFVFNYPTAIKAFYMEPVPGRPEVCLSADLLAPEGYGEIIGGSQRIADYDTLVQRMREHKLPVDDYKWYLDLRRYGSVPHSGFGLGIERTVSWICGLDHLREASPFPRMINRIYP